MAELARVHWHEGMFLLPQQMQAAERFGMHHLYLSHKWDLHHDWGLRAIDLDEAALANFRFAVRSLKARLPDGTLVAVPEDGTLAAVDLKPGFERGNLVTVYLAVPRLHLGRPNVREPEAAPAKPAPAAAGAAKEAGQMRYVLASEEIEDENLSDNAHPVPVRLLNLRLLLSTEDHSGYEVLAIARVQKPATADATPQLDRNYIPPLLACDAWSVLAADILQDIYHRIGTKVEKLASKMVTRGITFDSRSGEDPRIISELRVLNEAYALLGTLAHAQGIHPLPAYLELCRLVGQMAIFNATRKAPELPRYDHDDLGGCFYRVMQYLKESEPPEVTYQEREFEGQELRMQVSLEPEWLQPAWEMFVGVDSPLPTEQSVLLLTRMGKLDMKIGSAQRVNDIFEYGAAGLKFTHCASPPRALPLRPGLVYLQINRESQQQEWKHVQQSRTLAFRLNQNLVVANSQGNIQGQRELRIKTGSQTTTMRFTLFLVPREG
jgi:type VI secretion system protein ImpJ